MGIRLRVALCIAVLCLLLCVPAHAQSALGPHVLLEQGFEEFALFSGDFSAQGWQTHDGDGDDTYIIVSRRNGVVQKEFTFPGCRGPMAFITFSPDYTQPAITAINSANYHRLRPHSGNACAAAFAARTRANDDSLISPVFVPLAQSELSFFVRGFLPDDGAGHAFEEAYEVLVRSDEGEALLCSGIASCDAWQQVTSDLSAYDGQRISLVFRYCGNDAFLLLLDDITVVGTYRPTLTASLPVTELYAGDAPTQVDVTAAGLPQDYTPALQYTVLNRAVATVDAQGMLTPLSPGETLLKVMSEGAQCTLPVRVVQPTATVTLHRKDRLWLCLDRPQLLHPYFTPADAFDTALQYTWTPADHAIVDAENRLQGLRVGRAQLTASTAHGAQTTLEVWVLPSLWVCIAACAVLCALPVVLLYTLRRRKLAVTAQPRHGKHRREEPHGR